jgi:hypothetical protein
MASTCFMCPYGNGKMCNGGCGLGCHDCPGKEPEKPQK